MGGLSPRAPTLRREMSTPLRQFLLLALNCTPPGTQTRVHCSHCSRAFPLGFSQAWLCVWQVTLSETAHSPWSPRQVVLEGQPGSSRAWFGSAFCCQALTEANASLALSASLDACLLALPAPSFSRLFSGRLRLEASFFFLHFFSSQSRPVD